MTGLGIDIRIEEGAMLLGNGEVRRCTKCDPTPLHPVGANLIRQNFCVITRTLRRTQFVFTPHGKMETIQRR